MSIQKFTYKEIIFYFALQNKEYVSRYKAFLIYEQSDVIFSTHGLVPGSGGSRNMLIFILIITFQVSSKYMLFMFKYRFVFMIFKIVSDPFILHLFNIAIPLENSGSVTQGVYRGQAPVASIFKGYQNQYPISSFFLLGNV